MTIDEAIKELTKIVGKWQYGASNERDRALKLGIEALKRVAHQRSSMTPFEIRKLPGETD